MLTNEPTRLLTILAGLVTAALAAWASATATGSVNWWLLVVGFVPPAFGVLNRNAVVPVGKVETVVERIQSGANAVNELGKLINGEIKR